MKYAAITKIYYPFGVQKNRVPICYNNNIPIGIKKPLLEICEGASLFAIILEETTAHSLQQSEALLQSILKKASEGKLVAQNSKDEPAATFEEDKGRQGEGRGEECNVEEENPEGNDMIIVYWKG